MIWQSSPKLFYQQEETAEGEGMLMPLVGLDTESMFSLVLQAQFWQGFSLDIFPPRVIQAKSYSGELDKLMTTSSGEPSTNSNPAMANTVHTVKGSMPGLVVVDVLKERSMLQWNRRARSGSLGSNTNWQVSGSPAWMLWGRIMSKCYNTTLSA